MGKLKQFVNCRILRDHKITREDLWVRDGQIINPEKVFFDEQIEAEQKIDCHGNIIAPGFIEIQINGGFGYDFSMDDTKKAIEVVSKGLLSHGVTSYCPTVVTSPKEVYHRVLPHIKKKQGGIDGATILGVHVEGPFINVEKKGAHPPKYIIPLKEGIKTVEEMYGNLDNIKIVTLAPEFENAGEVIKELCRRGITVSLGHSTADLKSGEEGAKNGATLITHLFNAMLPFHHRDPGLVGLLASCKIKDSIFYGIISDNIHTHPAALRIAYRVCPKGLILVTDAISALGLEEGEHTIGQMRIEIKDHKAMIAGTDTLCGSIAPMIQCVKIFIEATNCSPEFALEAASLHPAQALKIDDRKGTLNFGSDADFIILNDNFDLLSTWIAGERVFNQCN